MKAITDEEKQLYDQFNIRDITLAFGNGVIIGNDSIANEAMTFEEMICENSSLKFGSCNASSFSVEVKDTEHTFKNETLSATMTTGDFTRNIGKFKVYSDNKTDDKTRRKIVAYDAIYGAKNKDVADWYLGLTFPTTLKAFRDSFFKYLGIEQVTTTLVNDSMNVEKTLSPTTMSALTVMEAICEINACFGHINSDGEFEYINLFERMGKAKDDAFSPYSIEYKMGTLKYEEFRCKHITQVTIRQEDNDIGCTVGEDGNAYVIQGNFLCYGKVETELTPIANNFMSKAYFYEYAPASVSTRGRPYMELGDFIKAVAQNGDTVVFPILRRSMSGIIALMDKYEAKGTESFNERKYTLTEQVQQIKGKSNVLTRTIEETKSEIKELDNDIKNNYSTTTDTKSLIDASAKDIKLEITDETDKKLQDYYTSEQTDTQINLSKDGIMQSVEQKIDALGSIYPSDDLYPASDLLPTDGYVSNAELSTSIAISEESITNRVEKRIEGERRDIDESYSEFVQKADRMDWLVSGGESESDMILTDSFIALIAKDLNISGKVTFSAFDSELKNKINTIDSNATNAQSSADAISDNIYVKGTTEINGGVISTGTITADKIVVGDASNYITVNSNVASTLKPPGAKTKYNVGTYKGNSYVQEKAESSDAFVMSEYHPWTFKDDDEVYFSGIVPNWSSSDAKVYVCVFMYTSERKYIGSAHSQALTLKKTSWNNVETSFQIGNLSDNPAYFTVGISKNGAACKIGLCDNALFERKKTGQLIVSGTITADLLATDAVKSRNYEKNVSGAFLNLKDGSFDSKYTKWDSTGKFEAVSGKLTNAEITNATIKGGKVDIQTSDKTYDQIELAWLNQDGSISASTIINPGQITVKGEGTLNQSVGIEGNRIVITNDDTGNSAVYSADIASVGLVNISTDKILISNGGVSGEAALSCDALVISDGSSSMSYADGTLWASNVQAGNGWTGNAWFQDSSGRRTTIYIESGIVTSVTTG